MRVEYEMLKGFKFSTGSSQISHSTMEAIPAKTVPFSKRIMFVDTLRDTTNMVGVMRRFGLRPHVVHSMGGVDTLNTLTSIFVNVKSGQLEEGRCKPRYRRRSAHFWVIYLAYISF